METVLHMGNCDCMSDKLLDHCYKRMIEMEADMATMQHVINNQRITIGELFEEADAMGLTILATQIQAAESEDRADDEKYKRLTLLMRR